MGVVIPVLPPEIDLDACLAAARESGADSIVVSLPHGAPSPELPSGVLVTRADRGRAAQISAGIVATSTEVIVIVHADSLLPPGGMALVRAAVEAGAVGGAFHKRFRSDRWLLRGAERRSRWWWKLGLSFGDQAQFVTRAALGAIGGFPLQSPEDMHLAMRLARHGRTTLLGGVVSTSARRLERDGVLRTWVRWWWIGVRAWIAARFRQFEW